MVAGIILLGATYFKIFVWQRPFFPTGWSFDLVLLTVVITLFLTEGGEWKLWRQRSKKAETTIETRPEPSESQAEVSSESQN